MARTGFHHNQAHNRAEKNRDKRQSENHNHRVIAQIESKKWSGSPQNDKDQTDAQCSRHAKKPATAYQLMKEQGGDRTINQRIEAMVNRKVVLTAPKIHPTKGKLRHTNRESQPHDRLATQQQDDRGPKQVKILFDRK